MAMYHNIYIYIAAQTFNFFNQNTGQFTGHY